MRTGTTTFRHSAQKALREPHGGGAGASGLAGARPGHSLRGDGSVKTEPPRVLRRLSCAPGFTHAGKSCSVKCGFSGDDAFRSAPHRQSHL